MKEVHRRSSPGRRPPLCFQLAPLTLALSSSPLSGTQAVPVHQTDGRLTKAPALQQAGVQHAWLHPNTEVRIDTVARGYVVRVGVWARRTKKKEVVRKTFSSAFIVMRVWRENMKLQ
ncbi:hypothetical protein DPEC_G00231100 [Dallia pectoralis]|uniref:Uncharacterized protein n=1 Tax=Dallia pectoralis TaxID=75939 RepID=A0ACC2FWZ1_DALPE|nr:hypothetical protein DPEC_G00231100 [Dallia pectoralis]